MIGNRRNQGINHTDVISSSIRSIGYDEKTGEMHVTFRDTGRYVYYGVPKNVYESMMMSSSKGKFIHSQIKPQYNFTKI